jgi:hypothetical protein
VLYKRGTLFANRARLPEAQAGEPAAPEQVVTLAEPTDVAPLRSDPSPEQIELARLRDENAALQKQIELLHQTWQSELEVAEGQAKKAAAQEHRSDDQARLAALRDALDVANEAFNAALEQTNGSLALALAGEALARLVEPQQNEQQWLQRSITARLAELRAQSILALHLPTDFDETLLAELTAQLPAKAIVVRDPQQPLGTARIALRLGHVEIAPARGLAGALAILAEAPGND